MNTPGYERLMRDHAFWADRVSELKRQSSEALGGASCYLHNREGKTCIALAFDECRDINQQEGPDNPISFEEVWEELDCEGKVCDACKLMRQLKAERMVASRRLGAVRAAITRVGRRLDKKESSHG